MRLTKECRRAVLAASLLGTLGCGDLETRPIEQELRFRGTVDGSEGAGTIAVTIASHWIAGHVTTGDVPATATLRLGSGFEVVGLYGTYDTVAQTLSLSGSGWNLTGTRSGDTLRGEYTAPSGENAFIAQEQSEIVRTFCGVNGFCGIARFDAGLGIRGSTVAGVVNRPPPDHLTLITFTGTYSVPDSTIVLFDPANPSGPPLGTGRLRMLPHATTVSVRFVFVPGDTCPWVGTIQ